MITKLSDISNRVMVFPSWSKYFANVKSTMEKLHKQTVDKVKTIKR